MARVTNMVRCELLYGVVNSGSSFRRKRRTPGAGSTENRLQLLKREERRGGVVFRMFSRESQKNGGHLHQIFYFTSAAYRKPTANMAWVSRKSSTRGFR